MKKILLIALVLSLNFLLINKSFSQGFPGNPDYVGLSFSIDTLSQFPPYSLSMPYNVLLGYVAMDSICSYGYPPDVWSFLDRQTDGDTLRHIMRHYYATIDWDPVRYFLARLSEQHFKDISPSQLQSRLLNNIKRAVPSPNKLLDYSLCQSHFIAHIKVLDTLTVIDTSAEPLGTVIKIVTAEIVDTIKGHYVPSCRDKSNILVSNTTNNIASIDIGSIYANADPPIQHADPGKCFQFHYCPDWLYYGQPILNKDSEYIVFLNFLYLGNSNGKIYYEFRSVGADSYEFLMYPINNGIVYDPKNEMGFGLNLTVDQFKAAIRNRISYIVNY
jgi:hypothetical protein